MKEQNGVRGVVFLFCLIGLFLIVVTLKSSGHNLWAMRIGFVGALALAAESGWFLVRRWRRSANFHEDGDVAFVMAVLLLCLIALGVGMAQTSQVFGRFLPIVPLGFACAGPFVRRYLQSQQ